MCLHANCIKQRGVKHVFRLTGKETKCLNERPLPKIPTEIPQVLVTEWEEELENDMGISDGSFEIHNECIIERDELQKSIATKEEELFEVRRIMEQKDEKALELKQQLKSISRFCKELEVSKKEYDNLMEEKERNIEQMTIQMKTLR
jgi:predicted RNase H-like nuclease (RuvC/YqgF family)